MALSPVQLCPAGHLTGGNPARQPGHWLLASLGKRVLRPGGLELTRQLLAQLRITSSDAVVEFAPGLGLTARMALAAGPKSYTGVDREAAVIERLNAELARPGVGFVLASAERTSLPRECATAVFGEAMLSMQTLEAKRRILAESFRLLQPGGRYAIHELALLPDSIEDAVRNGIEREMSMNIHTGVRPITRSEWLQLLEETGFEIDWHCMAPMHLLEPKRMLRDEGLPGVLRILFNLLRKPAARHRVLSMRRMFRRYAASLSAVAIVCHKPYETLPATMLPAGVPGSRDS